MDTLPVGSTLTGPTLTGCHFDYRSQTWLDGHDHGHRLPTGETVYCGADLATCTGQPRA